MATEALAKRYLKFLLSAPYLQNILQSSQGYFKAAMAYLKKLVQNRNKYLISSQYLKNFF
jgi:hypothetical protein